MANSFLAPENRLKEVREAELGWTQGQLADHAKIITKSPISTKTISRLEDGNYPLSNTTLAGILDTINVALKEKGRPAKSKDQLYGKLDPVRSRPRPA